MPVPDHIAVTRDGVKLDTIAGIIETRCEAITSPYYRVLWALVRPERVGSVLWWYVEVAVNFMGVDTYINQSFRDSAYRIDDEMKRCIEKRLGISDGNHEQVDRPTEICSG